MKYALTILGAIAILALFTGCGDNPRIHAPLTTEETQALLDVHVTTHLNNLIAENRNHQAYRLGRNRLAICSLGIIRANEVDGDPFEIVNYTRYYDIFDVEVNFRNPVFGEAYQLNEGSDEWFRQLNFELFSREKCTLNVAGLTILATLSPDWQELDRRARINHQISAFRKLPDPRIDHAQLLAFPGTLRETVLPQTLTLSWDSIGNRWTIPQNPTGAMLNAPEAPQQTSHNELIRFFQSKNIQYRNQRWVDRAAIPALEKYERGLIFVNGKWIEKVIVEQTNELAKELQILSYGINSLDAWNRLLATTNASPKATNRQDAIQMIERKLESLFQKAADEAAPERIAPTIKLLESQLLQQLVLAKSARLRALLKDHQNKLRTNQKARQTARLKRLQLLNTFSTDFKENRMTERQFARLSALPSEIQTIFCEYAYLTALQIRDKTVVARCQLMDPTLSLRSYINPCRNCSGAGLLYCGSCGGSGNCRKCNGAGQTFVAYGLRTRSSSKGYYASCATNCTNCGGSGKLTCTTCQGRRGDLNMPQITQRQSSLAKRLAAQIAAELRRVENSTDAIPDPVSVADLFRH